MIGADHRVTPKTEVGDGSWRLLANCRGCDPALFFPERGEMTREAKAVCNACVVREECLEYALSNGEKYGLWGGVSERQRRRMRTARRKNGTSKSYIRSTRPCPICHTEFTAPDKNETCSRRCARILQHRRSRAIPKATAS